MERHPHNMDTLVIISSHNPVSNVKPRPSTRDGVRVEGSRRRSAYNGLALPFDNGSISLLRSTLVVFLLKPLRFVKILDDFSCHLNFSGHGHVPDYYSPGYDRYRFGPYIV